MAASGLSIVMMRQVARRMVAGVTAAFVLLCSVYCGCDAGGANPTLACHMAQLGPGAANVPPCHRADSPSSGEHEPQSPLPLHHEGKECRHCQPAATGAEPAKASTHLTQSAAPLALAALPAFIRPHDQAPPHLPVVHGDLPPPNQQSTLLSLHCALTT